MLIVNANVEEIIELDNQIYLLKIFSPEIAGSIKPGQFVNLRVSESTYPLLRRPFSVCDVEGDFFYIMFNVLGEGTKTLAHKHHGEALDILGPLGNGFNLEGDFETAVLVAGGLGSAPFPYFIRKINGSKKILSFVGGRTFREVITYGMNNILTATDDGSLGFKGNVVELLNENIEILKSNKIKIFGCGPTPMLRALSEFSIKNNFECDISTESAMACGFGICQGCPVESAKDKDKFLLVCKDGPVFNVKDIVL
ncbi:MAG: dihydroorotate dehydrogenase electron transfer subunit [Ignavibacteriaceae bacterium]|nr:dihydroorotate dehydrogenase electron transfer subunit [Ignavibacteriaceae bacterium]